MALKRHNPAEEFDTMFRRHLKQGGAPVTPCVGFDADAASAYLERALDVSAQMQFEAHLAGCAACRRHMIGLARLDTEIELAAAKRPLVTAEPVWSRWYDTVAQWFDFSGWNRGWATTATACSLLLAVFAATAWRQLIAPRQAASTLAYSAVIPGTIAPSQAAGQRSGASDSAAQASVAVDVVPVDSFRLQQAQVGLIALAEDRGRITVPAPVTPPDIVFNRNLTAGAPQLEVSSAVPEISNPNFGSQPAPPPPPPGLTAAPVMFGPNRQNVALPVGFGGAPMRRISSQISLQPTETEKKEIVAIIVPEPVRARDAAAKSAADEKTTNDPAAAARSRELAKALKGRALGLVPFKEEARTKEVDVKEAKEQLKPLMKHLNGHTFYFDHSYWIDEEYKSDTTLPIVHLIRGKERYQQVLIENPTLEQFFELGQVIVVWKGKVYEVRKQ